MKNWVAKVSWRTGDGEHPALASVPAATLKTREQSITRGVNRRFSDGGGSDVSFHTQGSAVVKGKTITFNKSRIGFTGSAFQGGGGGVHTSSAATRKLRQRASA